MAGKRKNVNPTEKTKRKKIAVDCEKLICEVQKHPSIWDKSSTAYKDKGATYLAWKSVCKAMNKSELELKAKWKNLCDTFRRNLDSASGKSGDGLDDEKLDAVSWKYFKSMMYFKDSYIRRRTVSSYEDDDDSEDDCEETIRDENHVDDSDRESVDSFNVNIENDVPTASGGNEELNSSPSESQSVLQSTSTNRSKKSPKRRKSAGKAHNDSVMQTFAVHAERITQAITDPHDEPNEKFLGYLGDSLKLVPADRKRKCEKAILDLVNSYIDGVEVFVSPSQSIFVDSTNLVVT